jgi:excinuclease ABC subunit A
VVDRIAVKDGIQTRLADSFEQALKLADGWSISTWPTGRGRTQRRGGAGKAQKGSAKGQLKGAGLPDNRIVFSEKFACPVSGFTLDALEPRLFSFNAPQALPGLRWPGRKLLFDPQLVVPNEHLSLKQGAIVPWAKSNPPSPYYMQVLASLAEHFGFSLDNPWDKLPGEVKIVILHGTAGKPVPLTFIDGKKSYTVAKAFEGVIGNLNRRMLQTESAWMREELGKFQTAQPCETCNGARLKPEALSVKVAGSDISAATRLSVSDALEWFATLDGKLTSQQSQIAKAILKEINERLGFLNNVGLDYLNLDRTSGTLSGGNRSASAWPARSARACRACSTCSTNPRSACTSATTTACSNPEAPARPRQHGDRGRARRGRDPRGGLDRRSRAGRGRAWRGHRRPGHAGRHSRQREQPDRPIPHRRAPIEVPKKRRKGNGKSLVVEGRGPTTSRT